MSRRATVSFGRVVTTAITVVAAIVLCIFADPASAGSTGMKAADPSVLRVGSTYYSVQSWNNGIAVRQASSPDGLAAAPAQQVWTDTQGHGEIWAPDIIMDSGRFYIYFSAGVGSAHRMWVISSDAPASGYDGAAETQLALPDDKWAIDGTLFDFDGQRWFVWSGWEGDSNVEQNLYICRMSSPTQPTGARYVISQPREAWERVVGTPFINEGPQPIRDPNGQLHIVYSANGSWSDKYCLAEVRLRAGGDPTNVWDWYKSNGCLFGSDPADMMAGWDATLYADGPGHHTFVLLNGDINTSPPAGPNFPLMYHAVPKGTEYSWGERIWYTGSFCWWGDIAYTRQNVPGDNSNTGWSLKFFE
ncbi:hypothetical protein SLS62_004625 [Diatrype stigma]|uniref:Hydrolase n=1 Tax=Diatrype stigma TaxID=117547 RepID=A0AAN9YTG7_9PEZI